MYDSNINSIDRWKGETNKKIIKQQDLHDTTFSQPRFEIRIQINKDYAILL